MPIYQLTQTEYRSTFREPMRRIDPEEKFDPEGDIILVPCEGYLAECMQAHQLPLSHGSIDIEHLYLSADKAFNHIVMSHAQSGKQLIIITNQQAREIHGYYLLDLAAEYENSTVAA